MIIVRKSDERGRSKHDWLDSLHTFSFADYQDINHMGFGNLRVINLDIVSPKMGFGLHSHRDMEIISYVINGSLEHKDSLGTGSVIKPGEIQKMSAGSGISHSEFNPSPSDPLHFLQIWIIPDKQHLPPSYEQKTIPSENKNQFILIGSRDGRNNSISIHQDVELFCAYLQKGMSVTYHLKQGRSAWLQMVKGDITLNTITLSAGDGATIEAEATLEIISKTDAEFLLFDLG